MSDGDETFDDFLSRMLDEAGISKDDVEAGDAMKKQDSIGNDEDFLDWLEKTTGVDVIGQDLQNDGDFDDEALIDDEDDDELLMSLSAELQTLHPSKHNVLQICNAMEGIHKQFRLQVWRILLDIYTEGQSPRHVDVESSNVPEFREEHEGFLTAICESAVLRQNAVMNAYKIEDLDPEEEDYRRSLDEAAVEALKESLKRTIQKMKIDANSCDAGIADAILVLSYPGLHSKKEEIPTFVEMLQSKLIVSFDPSGNDPRIAEMVTSRSKLLDMCLMIHDKQVADHVLRVAPSKVSIPWRWWRCGFAGEMSIPALLVLWDSLIIDSCPLKHGDDGPLAYAPITGGLEGCDPRGPLVVYFIAALLIHFKAKLTQFDPSDTSTFMNMLRELATYLKPKEIRRICDKARRMRSSTPLNIVEAAFLEPSSPKPADAAQNQASSTASASNSKRPPLFSWGSMKQAMQTKLAMLAPTSPRQQTHNEPNVDEFITIIRIREGEESSEPPFDDENTTNPARSLKMRGSSVDSTSSAHSMDVDKPNEPMSIATARHKMCGMSPGVHFPSELFDFLGENWAIFPVYRYDKPQLCLLLVAHHRILYLASVGRPTLHEALTKTGKTSFSKSNVAAHCSAVRLYVRNCFHISQITKVVMRPMVKKPSLLDTKLFLNDVNTQGVRFRVHERYADTISSSLRKEVAEMQGLC